MLRKIAIGLLACVVFGTCSAAQNADEDGWISLFNGENLDGWKASEREGTFSVKDGILVVDGDRSHLFYTGPVENANFKNFEFRAQVKTMPRANSGIYFHTEYQETGWPAVGYECQVNTTHSDPRKTGSLYGVMDVMHDAPSKDGEWFDCYIKVEGRHILIQIDGKTTVDAYERDEWRRGRRRLSSGTFAIQGHDPDSVIHFRNIEVRPLPDYDGWITLFNGENLDGWKASEREGTFSVKDGMLVVDGDRSHLFYTGPVENANFKNFEFRAQVKTMEKANSGIFFHTEYQETGWPAVGYECQVNTTHSDPRKTGSLYGVMDVMHDAPSKDGEWFDCYIKVEGKHVLIKIDGKTTVDAVEQDEWRRGRRRLSSGTFAIQGHDPHSVIYFRHIQVRPLPDDDGWVSLFNGVNLDGWKASEREGTFSVKDGILVVDGDRSHLFYTGPVENANFKNFEFRAQVKTFPRANSGIYFHTEYQETGWPAVGYEAQVNTTHSDPRKTGSLYGVQDVMHDAPSKDGEWFDYYIKVEGKHILIKVDGKPTVDSIEQEGWRRGRRRLSSGTFAIQGHDPDSVIHFRNIRVRPLNPIKAVVVTGGHGFEHGPFFAIFQGHDDIRYVEAAQKDHSELFEDISNWDYDVIVLYNMTQNISPKRQANFKALLERGVGLVALHHAQAAFQGWEDYRKIIGARYPLKPQDIDGIKFETGTYKHDLDITVRIADPEHPITRGLSDFEIHDETYKGAWFAKDNHVLLTVDHPTSDKTVGWTRQHGNARVAFLQLGHDSKAYANSNYRQLVARAIRWSAGRL